MTAKLEGKARSDALASLRHWTEVPGRRSEVAWIRTDGDVTSLITGSASDEDFRKLATAVAGGTPATS